MKWKTEFIFFPLIIFCNVHFGRANWCTRSKSEHVQHQVTVMEKCNQTYVDSCSFFSWEQCTFSELVDCSVKKNITVTRYYVVEMCCPGFKIDPANNITCIPSSGLVTSSSEESFKSGVTLSGVEIDSKMNGTEGKVYNIASPTPIINNVDDIDDNNGSIQSVPKPPKPPKVWYKLPTTVSDVEKGPVVHGTENDHENNVNPTTSSSNGDDDLGDEDDGYSNGQTGHVVDDDDDLLFGLSHGAYAGIICTLLFVFCVLVLIMLHIRKRSKKNKAKGKDANAVEMETTQKMLNVPA